MKNFIEEIYARWSVELIGTNILYGMSGAITNSDKVSTVVWCRIQSEVGRI